MSGWQIVAEQDDDHNDHRGVPFGSDIDYTQALGWTSYLGGASDAAFFSASHSGGPSRSGFQSNQSSNSRPVVTVDDLAVVSSEVLSGSVFAKAYDPDNDAIVRYRFEQIWPYEENRNHGYFTVNGNTIALNKRFQVNAANIDKLVFHSAPRGQRDKRPDTVKVWAQDEHGLWSKVKAIDVRTLHNLNRPVVLPKHHVMVAGSVMDADNLFNWSDPDGNTVKKIRVMDNSSFADGSYLEFNGNRRVAKKWFTFSIDELSQLKVVASLQSVTDQIRIKVFDGKHWSKAQVSIVNAVARPTVDAETRVILNELERVPLASLFRDGNSVPPITHYEIVDLNGATGSGAIFSGFNQLAANQIHTVSAAATNFLRFRGGVIDNRFHDRILVRGFNGNFWSKWHAIEVMTEPHMLGGLHAPDDWTKFLPGEDPLIISYSFMQQVPLYYPSGSAEENGFSRSSPTMNQKIREILTEIEGIINVRFQEVSDLLVGGVLRFGTFTNGDDRNPGHAYFPENPADDERGGDVWFNNLFDPNIPVNWPGVYNNVNDGGLGTTMMRILIGRALGLKYPSEGIPKLSAILDSQRYSIMSFNTIPEIQRPNWDGDHFLASGGISYAQGYQLYDVAALQDLYGVNTNFNAGDTTYVFSANGHTVKALVDAGGVDTLDLSNQNSAVTINLRQGAFNSFGTMFGRTGDRNMAIAYGTEIENAVGSRFNDSIMGNELDNVLEGGHGQDTLNGLGGNDILRGDAGNDNYQYDLWGGDVTLDDGGFSDVDTLEVLSHSPQFDSFQEDLSFRRDGNNLVMQVVMNRNGPHDLVDGTVTILNMDSMHGVETLNLRNSDGSLIGGSGIDLTSIMASAGNDFQHFQLTGATGTYGAIAAPI